MPQTSRESPVRWTSFQSSEVGTSRDGAALSRQSWHLAASQLSVNAPASMLNSGRDKGTQTRSIACTFPRASAIEIRNRAITVATTWGASQHLALWKGRGI